MGSRSHHGCARCKKRRQKCDEGKPSCGRCLRSSVACEYSITLKWNGRVPRAPNELQRRKPTPSSSSSTGPFIAGHQFAPDCTWPSTPRLLLHHFVSHGSLLSSHSRLRDQICEQVVPMTFQSPALRYATIAFAALHRSTLLHRNPGQFVPEAMITVLLSASLRLLRQALDGTDPITLPLLHTIRTLCHCEIYSGKADSSWRVHVNGARAILQSAEPMGRRHDPGSCHGLWERWYESIQALTAVTDLGLLEEYRSSAPETKDRCHLDIYTGYSSDLNGVFTQIGAAANKSHGEGHAEAPRLERLVWDMIRRDHDGGLSIPAGLGLNDEEIRSFNACNAAYQYSALIHIYRRIWGLESQSSEIQRCVKAILHAVTSILLMTSLSPWVLLTTPIYTAGCEALEQDRPRIKTLLSNLYETLQIRNVLRARQMLEQRWEAVDTAGQDPKHSRICDFIPY